MLNEFVLIGSRYIIKTIYYLFKSDSKLKKSILIYGAGESGILTYDVFQHDIESDIQVVGFIDDSPHKTGKQINGVPVYNSNLIDEVFIENKKIKEIIISIQNLPSKRLMEIVDSFSMLPVEVKIVPASKTWVNGDFKSKEIKKIKIEDLLGRKEIALNNPILKKEYKHKIILITGAAGSIGSEIARQISQLDCKHIVLIDQAESDLYNLQQYFHHRNLKNCTSIVANVQDKKRMDVILKQFQPEVIFHALLPKINNISSSHIKIGKGTIIFLCKIVN